MLINSWGLVNSWQDSIAGASFFKSKIIGADMSYKQGVAVPNFSFTMLDKNLDPVTTGTTTGVMVTNGVASATLANASYIGNNFWNISFTAGEMDGADQVAFTPVNASAVVEEFILKTYTELDSNLQQINGVTLPVDNLEAQYDGTGITGDNFPATQTQVANLSTGAGGLSTVSDSVTITTGTQTGGDYTDTFAFDGAYHIIQDAGNVTDFYYEADVGNSGVTTGFVWDGYVQGNNDTVNVFGYDWVATSWVQIGSIAGASGVSPQEVRFSATVGMTGTDANDGKVRIRFQSANAAVVATDRLLFEFTAIQDSGFIIHSGTAQGGTTNSITLDAGASNIDDFYTHTRVVTVSGTGAEQENIITAYSGSNKLATVKGAWKITPDATTRFNITPAQVHAATTAGGYDGGKVYVNGIDGTAGTVKEVNGTISNPSNNMPDARAIADSVGVKTLFFRGGAAFTLDQDYQDFVFEMKQGQLLNMGGFDVSGAVFERTGITGVMTSSARTVFERCGVLDASLDVCNLLDSGVGGTITLTSRDRYLFDKCFENDTGEPTLNINGDGITETHVEIMGYNGTLTIQGMTSVDVVKITGDGDITLDPTNNGGTLDYHGDIKLYDNSTTSPTITCGNICDVAREIKEVPTNTEFNARTLLANEYSKFDSTSDSVTINQSSADLVLSSGDVDGYTLEQSQRLILSANTGKLSGAATANIVIRDAADTKTRIAATVDEDGNRVATTLDAS